MAATILGTTGDITTCERCGRSDLKKTIVLNLEGEIVHYGTECASQTVGQDAKEIRKSARVADTQAKAVRQAARAEAAQVSIQSWESFCSPFGGIAEAVAYFGGFIKAREAWRAV